MLDIENMKKSMNDKWNKIRNKNSTEEVKVNTMPETNSQKAPATIGPSIHLKGELTGEEGLIIEGTVEGTINLKQNDLTIGKNGQIKADVYANIICIEGELKGDMFGKEKVIIRNTGRVQGNIESPRVIIEDGAKFKGSIDMGTDEKGNKKEQPGSINAKNNTNQKDNRQNLKAGVV